MSEDGLRIELTQGQSVLVDYEDFAKRITENLRGYMDSEKQKEQEIALPPLVDWSVIQLRHAGEEMQREAFQGFFLLAKRERERQLLQALRDLAAAREQAEAMESLKAQGTFNDGVEAAAAFLAREPVLHAGWWAGNIRALKHPTQQEGEPK